MMTSSPKNQILRNCTLLVKRPTYYMFNLYLVFDKKKNSKIWTNYYSGTIDQIFHLDLKNLRIFPQI